MEFFMYLVTGSCKLFLESKKLYIRRNNNEIDSIEK